MKSAATMGAVTTPDSLVEEFARVTPEQIEELQNMTIRLRSKGYGADSIVSDLVAAGWSEEAAHWYVAEVFMREEAVKVLVGRREPVSRSSTSRPPWMSWVRVVGLIDISVAILLLYGLNLLFAWSYDHGRDPLADAQSSIAISAGSALVFAVCGFSLLLIRRGCGKHWLKLTNVLEYLFLALSCLLMLAYGYALFRLGPFLPGGWELTYLAVPISWLAARALRRECVEKEGDIWSKPRASFCERD